MEDAPRKDVRRTRMARVTLALLALTLLTGGVPYTAPDGDLTGDGQVDAIDLQCGVLVFEQLELAGDPPQGQCVTDADCEASVGPGFTCRMTFAQINICMPGCLAADVGFGPLPMVTCDDPDAETPSCKGLVQKRQLDMNCDDAFNSADINFLVSVITTKTGGPGTSDVDGDGRLNTCDDDSDADLVIDDQDCDPLDPAIGDCDDGSACTIDECNGGACVHTPFPEMADTDDDGVLDPCDNCPEVGNPDQTDGDGDGVGDACQGGCPPGGYCPVLDETVCGTQDVPYLYIPAGVTITCAPGCTQPVVFNVAGNAVVEGVVDLSGEAGSFSWSENASNGNPSGAPGGGGGQGWCGGQDGGDGGHSPSSSGQNGSGSGGGKTGSSVYKVQPWGNFWNGGNAGGGGYGTAGQPGFLDSDSTGNPGQGGAANGPADLSSIPGGSGGGGGSGGLGGADTGYGGAGGGAGGGVFKLVAGGTIFIEAGGEIRADGGVGGHCQDIGAVGAGGAGSGGAIWLSAVTLINDGTVSAMGGVNCFQNGGDADDGRGGDGRIRVDVAGGAPPAGSFSPAIGHLGYNCDPLNPLDCDDGDPCTTDSCEAGECVFEPLVCPGDGDPCTVDECAGGVCLSFPDPAMADSDQDGVLDPCDNCPDVGNPGQEDEDGDGIGDACPDACPPGGFCPETSTTVCGTLEVPYLHVPAGVTVTCAPGCSQAVVFDVSGNALVEGTIDLSGADGNFSYSLNASNGNPSGAPGGAGGQGRCGGYSGGTGGHSPSSGGQNGSGGGGGKTGSSVFKSTTWGNFWNGGNAGGGGYGTSGGQGFYKSGSTGNAGQGGATNGAATLSSLVGGSGGGGGSGGLGGASTGYGGAGGGAGGGVLKIVATGTIEVAAGGVLRADGGTGGSCQDIGAVGGGGAGAGGAIWLSAPTVTNDGTVSAMGGVNCFLNGGAADDGEGGNGRVRVDNAGGTTPAGSYTPTPGYVGAAP